MKTSMQVFGSLCLLLCWTFPIHTQRIFHDFMTQDDPSFPLNMVTNSVDDMYCTCATEMEKKVKEKFFEKEMKNNPFKDAWKQAETCAEKNINKREKGDEALTKDHMQAICAYTAGGKAEFYKTFNEEVRTKGEEYGSSFRFHSLHFWLTRAIQILNHKNKCYTTFRRTNAKFTDNNRKEIRFGTFTSTSNLPYLERFGNTTCFKIQTCHGAYLKKYPKLGNKEEEVLIPPYEKFKIISKGKFEKKLSDCEFVYVLNSSGVQSNHDCQIQEKRHS